MKFRYRISKLGEDVVIIGNPWGLEQTVSYGIVSAIRKIQVNDTISDSAYLIQFTTPVSPGFSGSPIFDKYGRGIGMVTSQFTVG